MTKDTTYPFPLRLTFQVPQDYNESARKSSLSEDNVESRGRINPDVNYAFPVVDPVYDWSSVSRAFPRDLRLAS